MVERSARPLVGWVVDVQNDFMNPPALGGRLYVADLADSSDVGATSVQPIIERAVEWMRANCVTIIYSADWHGADDAEIDAVSPDPSIGTYPPHCMGRSEDPDERDGAAIIASIRPSDPLILDRDTDEAAVGALARMAVTERRPVIIRKNQFDVFAGNPRTEAFLSALIETLGMEPEFVVIGVSRDVCVTRAVDGLQARGFQTIAISDATWGLGLESESDTLARWRVGGMVMTVADLKTGMAHRK
ncbi:MAG: isochorismatase family protein [Gemmatimonadota bacterium]